MKYLFFLLLLPVVGHGYLYYSQYGQDKFVYENFFKDLRDGIFIDIGAHDGISLSNSYFFERELGWSGICIEPNSKIFPELVKNRKCVCIEGCVANQSGENPFLMISGPVEMLSGIISKYDSRHVERIEREIAKKGGTCEVVPVRCFPLNDILEEYKISHVNFLSIDTEGGELEILSSIDFSRYQIDVIAVENNYSDLRFLGLLINKGFRYVASCGCDMIFVNKDL